MDERKCSRTCLYSRSLLDTRRGRAIGGVAVPLASRQTNNRRLLGSRDNLCDHTSRSIKFSPPTAVLPVSAPTMPKWTKRSRFLTPGFRGQHIGALDRELARIQRAHQISSLTLHAMDDAMKFSGQSESFARAARHPADVTSRRSSREMRVFWPQLVGGAGFHIHSACRAR